MKKNKVVLNLKGLSISEKIHKGRDIVKSLTGNPDFDKPFPTLAEITAGLNELEEVFTEGRAMRLGASSITALQNQKDEAVDVLLTGIGGYVEVASKGDEAKIRSAGLDVKSSAVRVGVLSLPQSLVTRPGVMKGVIALKWKAVRGARSYVVQITTDINDAESWKQVSIVTKASAQVEGLQPGIQYWFQVAATGASGQGPWSDPATRMAS